ncbi:ABC transporter substrate-binding protein [Mesorhizobium sp. CO1-1-8]|uniref:ABC transporter substrate-binding protein n=1 Tax=Mesorhizobium sp. CO1-1-8 TaxID=2876631 RepID=UPI001CD0852E|nr:ABC transporter substrate-binding protein [Mesorhizobium sp. CO1-1-8]MBZ9772226.1 ABC transporter substrate-binding protein [Mesorhizobium sp. CO1-1-8]
MKRLSVKATMHLLAVLLSAAGMTGVAAAQECEVKLGVVGPMSGSAAAWGLAAKAGAEFAAAMVNKDGGLSMGDRKCQVKIYSFDSQYTAPGGAAGSNYLASEGVRITMGPVGSPEVTGFRPGGTRNGQVSFNSSYMVGAIGPDNPLEFHALQAPQTWGPELVKAAQEQFKFKSIIVIAPNDQGGTDAGKQLAGIYSKSGVEANSEYYQRATTNFGPLATRIMIANPDAVEMSTMPPGDATNLTRQLLEAGYQGVLGVLGGAGSTPVLQGAGGPEKLKGFYWLETSPVDHPGIIKLKEDFAAVMKTPAPESPVFPVFALAAEVALKGVSDAATDQDPEKIAEALRKLAPESRYMGKAGWRGKTLYGINQELTFPVGLGMVIDGKKGAVKTVEIPAE